MSPADETVECTLSYDGVGEEGVPVFGCPIGGDYQGAGVMAPVDKFIKVLGLSLSKLPHCSAANTGDRVAASGGLGITSAIKAFQPCGGVGSP